MIPIIHNSIAPVPALTGIALTWVFVHLSTFCSNGALSEKSGKPWFMFCSSYSTLSEKCAQQLVIQLPMSLHWLELWSHCFFYSEAILNDFQCYFWIYFLSTCVLRLWFFKWEMCLVIGNLIAHVPALKWIAVPWVFVHLSMFCSYGAFSAKCAKPWFMFCSSYDTSSEKCAQ